MTDAGLETITELAAADVYKAGVLAATLERGPQGVAFRYLSSYSGPPVATTLPLGAPRQQPPGGSLPGYFAGLLPEGRRLGALGRAVKTSLDDELSLLLAVGGDTVGDVVVVPRGVRPTGVVPRVVLGPDQPIRFAEVLADLDLRPDRHGLAGVQDKVSGAMITLPAQRAGTSVILKLDPPEFPHLVVNEHLMLQAAARHRLHTVEAELVHDADGVPGLAVVRFDRLATGDGVRALAVEDGCQVLDRPPGDKYLVGYAATFAALADVCDARPLALRTLLAQLVFAVLSANGDAHAKNFSVVQQPDGEWVVAPAYDLPTSYPYGDTTLAMPVNGRRTDVGAADVLALGAQLGLPAKATLRVLREATERVDAWLPLLDDLPFDRGRVAKLRRVVQQRCRRLTP